VLACGPEAVLSYRDAGHLRNLRASGNARIEVTVPAATRPRRPGIRVNRTNLGPDDVTVIDGIPVTSLARTLLDLAAVLRPHQLARAMEAAERQRTFDRRPIDALLISIPRHPGARNLRAAPPIRKAPPPRATTKP
jgi:predicted transcriptional regulator of viral defense system